jgi:hypothetical protein
MILKSARQIISYSVQSDMYSVVSYVTVELYMEEMNKDNEVCKVCRNVFVSI